MSYGSSIVEKLLKLKKKIWGKYTNFRKFTYSIVVSKLKESYWQYCLDCDKLFWLKRMAILEFLCQYSIPFILSVSRHGLYIFKYKIKWVQYEIKDDLYSILHIYCSTYHYFYLWLLYKIIHFNWSIIPVSNESTLYYWFTIIVQIF